VNSDTAESVLLTGYISDSLPAWRLTVVLAPLTPLISTSRDAHFDIARMKFATGSSVPLIVLSALTAAAQVEDVLHSKRMVKRGIDADGNYNICM
jgi:hypothetical protein